MDKGMAHALLNQAKLGMDITLQQINEALLKTGDMDVFGHAEQANRTLCTDGFESGDYRPSKAENQRVARVRLELVGRYWAANQDTN